MRLPALLVLLRAAAPAPDAAEPLDEQEALAVLASPEGWLAEQWRRLRRAAPPAPRRGAAGAVLPVPPSARPGAAEERAWYEAAAPLYNRAATMLAQGGSAAGAAGLLLRSLALNPWLAPAWNNLGTVCQHLGLLGAAVWFTERAAAAEREQTALTAHNLANLYAHLAAQLADSADTRSEGAGYAVAASRTYQLAAALPSASAEQRETALGAALRVERLLGREEHAARLAAQLGTSAECATERCWLEAAARRAAAGDESGAARALEQGAKQLPRSVAVRRELFSLHYSGYRFGEALRFVEQAVRLDPADPQLRYGFASALSVQGRLVEAHRQYASVVAAGPGFPSFALATVELSNHAQRLGLWARAERGFRALRALTLAEASSGSAPSQSPFSCLGYPYTAAEILQVARAAAEGLPGAAASGGRRAVPAPRRELRVAVATADAGDTNVGRDIIGWLREGARQEVPGGRVSIRLHTLRPLSPACRWARATLAAAGGASRVLQWPSGGAAAAAAVERERVHILINLNGFSKYARNEVFALAPAPLAAVYKGCPSTFGLPGRIQFLVADTAVVPPRLSRAVGERLVLMPESFFVTSYPLHWPLAEAGGAAARRARALLPEALQLHSDGPRPFVFCNFNHLNKVRRWAFGVWAELMRRAAGSLLWLLRMPQHAEEGLLREAAARGIPPSRVIFTDLLPLDGHLWAKGRCDLFLDTDGFNAHGTATDVLWAGVPLVTITGIPYQSRVAASHLGQLGLGALAAQHWRGYERRCAAFARSRPLLRYWRERLGAARAQSPLFDTGRWSADFAQAMALAWRAAAASGGRARHVVPARRRGRGPSLRAGADATCSTSTRRATAGTTAL
eukprot:TRINITY_DN37278_c1_g1_i2.p1 TRINITY_DN37278_c1_g1~~TRINITY_DN37278_c1_g1_i2.p1  ORF type:complete len:879 (+),score=256.19 TRINITY_DN37278_c1_g1_i2:66-2639(+)